MAYVSKDLNLVAPSVGQGNGGSLWTYTSTADAVAAIIAAAYITDGAAKGMKVGDLVAIAGTDTGIAQVTVIDTSTNPDGDVTMV